MKKRKDGRYVERVTFPDGSWKDVYGYSQPEVNAKKRALTKQAEAGVDVDDKSTVGEWAQKWFKEYKNSVRNNTAEMYKNSYNKYILPELANKPLKSIRPIHIQNVMNKASFRTVKSKDGEKQIPTSESLQSKVLITMSQIFQTAYENRLISYNPCVGISVKKQQKEEKIKTLNEVQQISVLNASKDTRAELFVALGLYCGLRREESLGAMWTDIDFENKCIKLSRSVTFKGNQPVVEPFLKSSSSRRTVPIPPPLTDMLNSSERKSIYLCPSAKNVVMSKVSYNRMWESVQKNVDFEITSHMLRHTYCTMLHKAGIDLKTAQYLMGHSDIRTTSKIYMHIDNDQIENAARKIQSIFESSVKSQSN